MAQQIGQWSRHRFKFPTVLRESGRSREWISRTIGDLPLLLLMAAGTSPRQLAIDIVQSLAKGLWRVPYLNQTLFARRTKPPSVALQHGQAAFHQDAIEISFQSCWLFAKIALTGHARRGQLIDSKITMLPNRPRKNAFHTRTGTHISLREMAMSTRLPRAEAFVSASQRIDTAKRLWPNCHVFPWGPSIMKVQHNRDHP